MLYCAHSAEAYFLTRVVNRIFSPFKHGLWFPACYAITRRTVHLQLPNYQAYETIAFRLMHPSVRTTLPLQRDLLVIKIYETSPRREAGRQQTAKWPLSCMASPANITCESGKNRRIRWEMTFPLPPLYGWHLRQQRQKDSLVVPFCLIKTTYCVLQRIRQNLILCHSHSYAFWQRQRPCPPGIFLVFQRLCTK